jgi:hypothetical protein
MCIEALNLAMSLLPFENAEPLSPKRRRRITSGERAQLNKVCEQYGIDPSDPAAEELLALKLAEDIEALSKLDGNEKESVTRQFWHVKSGTRDCWSNKILELAWQLWRCKLSNIELTGNYKPRRRIRALGISEIVWHIQKHFNIDHPFEACLFLQRNGLPLRKPRTIAEEAIYKNLKLLWDNDLSKANLWSLYKQETKLKSKPGADYPGAEYEVYGLKTRDDIAKEKADQYIRELKKSIKSLPDLLQIVQ